MTSNLDLNPRMVVVESETDFDRAVAFLWRYKTLLFFAACFGGAAGFGTSFLFTPEYKADAVLVPSDEMLGSNLNGMLGGLGGLASLVGLDKSGNRESEALETLKSRALTTLYIDKNGLLPIIFHSRWDSTAHTWKAGSHIPTLADGYRVFDRRIRTVVENRKTGLITISITWEDPRLAKDWTEGLVNGANDRLRTQAIERSSRNIEYLKKASDETSVMEVKATISKLMESEIKKQMVASGDRNYAFRVVDPPVAPERKVFPLRSVFLILGALAAPMLWTLIIVLKSRIWKPAR
jgi:LPS O-antigen subunit length determinant protein (WzzB/FepE family)